MRVIEEQERDLYGVPQLKVVSTGIFDKDYFKQPWITYDNYIKPNCIVKLEKETNKMEAKKCDRCGKLYEQNGNNGDRRVRFKFKEVFGAEDLKDEVIAKRQLQEVYIKTYSTELDLCPECRESFKKWFEES